jgi:hypothetical protein
VFMLYAGAYFIGGVCWLFLDSVTPLDRPPEKAPEPA